MGFRDFLVNKAMPAGGISVNGALGLLSKGGVLVDVRSQGEYEAGHAPGSRMVDAKALRDDPWFAVHGDDPLAEPEGTIVLICDNGLRSGLLVEGVRAKGYRCEFLKGGLIAWRQDGQMLIPGPQRRR